MQIGVNQSLPGCAPGSGALPPSLPSPPDAGQQERRVWGRRICVVIGVLLLLGLAGGVYGVLFSSRLSEVPVVRSARAFVKPWYVRASSGLAFLPFAGTNTTLTVSTVQRRIVSARAINETKRVEGMAGDRLIGENPSTDSATKPATPTAGTTGAVVSVHAPLSDRTAPTVTNSPATASRTARGVKPPIVLPPAWPPVCVTALLGSEHGRVVARINGSLVSLGDTVDGMKVVALSPRSVTLDLWGQRREFFVNGPR